MHRSPNPRTRLALAAVALAVLSGCASTARPVIYQPPQAAPAKAARVDSDLERCREQALQAVGLNASKGRSLADVPARDGAMEFVNKAIESLVVGTRNTWERARGAGAGEAAGTLTGMLLNWNEPDRVHREYVDLCMKKRGHTVLGWR
ncbi:MAG TPA: hypothetical protein VLM87_14810 [Rubrivivax sp.]|nr:hypothetical protein [Rubrivivax sp.]